MKAAGIALFVILGGKYLGKELLITYFELRDILQRRHRHESNHRNIPPVRPEEQLSGMWPDLKQHDAYDQGRVARAVGESGTEQPARH
jgi:hypothetical protein